MSRGRVSVLLSVALLGRFVVPPASARLAHESTIAAVEQLDSRECLTSGVAAAKLVKGIEDRQSLPVPGVWRSSAAAERCRPRWRRSAAAEQRGVDRSLCTLYLRLSRSDPGDVPH